MASPTSKGALKRTYLGWGKVYAHALKNTESYPEKWTKALQKVSFLLLTLPVESDVNLKEELMDAFMLGVAQTFEKERSQSNERP